MTKIEELDDATLATAAGGAPGVKTDWGNTAKTWGNIMSGKPGGFWGGYGSGGSGGGSGGGGQQGGGGGGQRR